MYNQIFQEYSNYCQDFYQRSVLFWDTVRIRGNQMLTMQEDNSSTVLNFQFEKLIDGSTFDQPINYWLAKIIPPKGVKTDKTKRPYVIQDPRAGQGPGIGGFKKDSEIGDALKNGHPVYFIGFNAKPCPNQTYEDIIHGQLKFYQYVNHAHPHSPKMCLIGNCAAGYLSMFSAMQEPEIFGPILIAGSPLSYWHGVRGKNPMRLLAGLAGGSWINRFLADIGGGKFDGTYLVLNFDLLSPSNFLWSKQYNLFANIYTEKERYLNFEKWWGDFILFNKEEILWLVDHLFIGNELTTGRLMTADGTLLDPRKITSPIITFVSDGDNISPPAQSAGWIADLYSSTEEIIARGKTIVYCLNHKVGHLAIFTATKVGQREDEVFIENMDSIDVLPPGLYELVIDTPASDIHENVKLKSHYELRTIEDVKALGFNTLEEDRAFNTINVFSKAFSQFYNNFINPYFTRFNREEVADFLKRFRPLRLSYTLFSDRLNPLMGVFSSLAKQVDLNKTLNSDNYFLNLEQEYSKLIENYLNNLTQLRDNYYENFFFSLWSNPYLQKFWKTDEGLPRITPSTINAPKKLTTYDPKLLKINNELEALFRLVGFIFSQRRNLNEFAVRVLISEAKQIDHKLDNIQVKVIIRNQALVIREAKDEALSELKKYLTKNEHKTKMQTLVMRLKERLDLEHQFSPEPEAVELVTSLFSD